MCGCHRVSDSNGPAGACERKKGEEIIIFEAPLMHISDGIGPAEACERREESIASYLRRLA